MTMDPTAIAAYQNEFTSDEVRRFWNYASDRYDHQAAEKVGLAHKRRFIDAMELFLPRPGDLVLNVWSRTGNIAPYMRKKEEQLNILHLELSDDLLAMSRKKYPAEQFAQTHLDALPVKTGSMDWVISLETLEHCPNPMIFLLELERILRPDGTLILSCPPRTAEPLAWLAHKLLRFHGEGPHQFLPSRVVKSMIIQSGFILIQHLGTVLFPFGPEFIQKWGWKMEKSIQETPFREICIRQFFIARKGRNGSV